MKIKKLAISLLACSTLLVGVIGLASCNDEVVEKKLTVLDAPANVVINEGDEIYSSEDDTVTFDAVENAVSYQVYLWKEGDTEAMVTSSDSTTVPLAYPIEAGTYNVSVVAVGDNVTYGNSNGSEYKTYTLAEKVTQKLGTVSNISMDFSNIDAENAQYPTISFTGVEGAVRYSVYMYTADASGNKKSEDPVTNFNVPAANTDNITYMMDSTNYGDLKPERYLVEITAIGDNDLYTDGDIATGTVEWKYGKYATPVVEAVSEYSAGSGPFTSTLEGGIVLVTNYSEFFVGDQFTVYVYADEACTQLVTSGTITYTTSESFGIISVNNYVGFNVVAAGASDKKDTDLEVGQTYYIKVQIEGDGYIYETSDFSEVVAFVPEKVGTGESGNSSGGPGGGPGGSN